MRARIWLCNQSRIAFWGLVRTSDYGRTGPMFSMLGRMRDSSLTL